MTDEEKKARAEKLAAMHIKEIMESAEAGCDEDQCILAGYYKHGEYGLPQDYTEAIKWYRKAAGQGYAWALYDLGICYADGIGVAKNAAQAKQYFIKAVLADNNGEDDVTLNSKDAIRLLDETGEDAEFVFSEELRNRIKQNRKIYNPEQAKTVFGWDYTKWLEVPQDCAEAVAQYIKAAEQGDPYAQFRLGLCYVTGLGVEQDIQQAKKYFTEALLADNNGDDFLTIDIKIAEQTLAYVETGEVQDFAEAFEKMLYETREIYSGH